MEEVRNIEELRKVAEQTNYSLEELLYSMVVDSTHEIQLLNEQVKKLKDENFRLDYQNIRIKGALFEFEMNYYQDNLKGNVAS